MNTNTTAQQAYEDYFNELREGDEALSFAEFCEALGYTA